MLTRPELSDNKIIQCLQDSYSLRVSNLDFLALGNDVNSAVFKIVADDLTYLLKLRSGPFDDTTVTIPKWLYDQGVEQIIPPIETRQRKLWTNIDSYVVTLYRYMPGRNGFDVSLSDSQWIEFGTALRSIHQASIPRELTSKISQESYSSKWCDKVKVIQKTVETATFSNPVAADLAAFLRVRADQIALIVSRAEELGKNLRALSPKTVLCHADIHAGNVLLSADGRLYIVDWDTTILAPKERDLMFVGGGVCGIWNSAREESLFYQGYGQEPIDWMILTYYRYERIVEDIVAYCDHLLLPDEIDADSRIQLKLFCDQFQPKNVVAIAHKSHRILMQDNPLISSV